jgi:hypothetical protein
MRGQQGKRHGDAAQVQYPFCNGLSIEPAPAAGVNSGEVEVGTRHQQRMPLIVERTYIGTPPATSFTGQLAIGPAAKATHASLLYAKKL